jgi:biopolymer transport protein ExbD
MSLFAFERRRRAASGIDIAPLVDIVFLLLIFFVLSSHFVVSRGFKVNLPGSSHALAQKNERVEVAVDSKGRIFLNGSSVELQHLGDRVAEALSKMQSKTVVIHADEVVSLGRAVAVMDIARDANADGLVLSTKTARDEKSK